MCQMCLGWNYLAIKPHLIEITDTHVDDYNLGYVHPNENRIRVIKQNCFNFGHLKGYLNVFLLKAFQMANKLKYI